MNPALVLADEPSGNLDTENADAVFDLMRDVNVASGTTFLIVTHDPRLAQRCDRIIELVDGRIVADARTRTSCAAAKRSRARRGAPSPGNDERSLRRRPQPAGARRIYPRSNNSTSAAAAPSSVTTASSTSFAASPADKCRAVDAGLPPRAT